MNILIPMAGAGSRFEKAGYKEPKPLINIFEKPMIQWVIENIKCDDANYIFIVQENHFNKYDIKNTINKLCKKYEIIKINGITEGAACTTLFAKSYINNNQKLIIANSDQFVEWSNNDFKEFYSNDNIDCNILTFKSNHPKWSYVKLNKNNFVEEVAEKKVISNIATVGIYFWKNGNDYVKYAEQMISKNIRVNNEFYVCPIFNEALIDNKKISIKTIQKRWGLGTPEDLDNFINNYGK